MFPLIVMVLVKSLQARWTGGVILKAQRRKDLYAFSEGASGGSHETGLLERNTGRELAEMRTGRGDEKNDHFRETGGDVEVKGAEGMFTRRAVKIRTHLAEVSISWTSRS